MKRLMSPALVLELSNNIEELLDKEVSLIEWWHNKFISHNTNIRQTYTQNMQKRKTLNRGNQTMHMIHKKIIPRIII
jgi:hypothetical protein